MRSVTSEQNSPATHGFAPSSWAALRGTSSASAASEVDPCNMSTYLDRVGEDDDVDFQDPDELAEEVATSDIVVALRALPPAEFHRLRSVYAANTQQAIELAVSLLRTGEEAALTEGDAAKLPADAWRSAIDAMHSNTGAFFALMECGLPEDVVDDD